MSNMNALAAGAFAGGDKRKAHVLDQSSVQILTGETVGPPAVQVATQQHAQQQQVQAARPVPMGKAPTQQVPPGGHYRPKFIRPILSKRRPRRQQQQQQQVRQDVVAIPASLAVPTVTAVVAGENGSADHATLMATKRLTNVRLQLAALEGSMAQFISTMAERLTRLREQLTAVEIYRGGVKVGAPLRKKRRPNKKHTRDPRQPKKPLSAYILFCNQERSSVKVAMGDNNSTCDHTVEMAKRWQLTNDGSRQHLFVEAQRLRHKYDDDMTAYNAILRANNEPRVTWIHCKCAECVVVSTRLQRPVVAVLQQQQLPAAHILQASMAIPQSAVAVPRSSVPVPQQRK